MCGTISNPILTGLQGTRKKTVKERQSERGRRAETNRETDPGKKTVKELERKTD